jgi:hypothetical protein
MCKSGVARPSKAASWDPIILPELMVDRLGNLSKFILANMRTCPANVPDPASIRHESGAGALKDRDLVSTMYGVDVNKRAGFGFFRHS